MKWIYAAISNHEVVAFHKKKEVIKIYIKNYRLTNPSQKIGSVRIKKKACERLQNFERLYLEQVGEYEKLYIQRRYVDAYLATVDLHEEELLNSIEDKLSILMKDKLSCSDKITVLKVLEIVENRKNKVMHYTPTLKELEDIFWRYEEYQNHVEYEKEN